MNNSTGSQSVSVSADRSVHDCYDVDCDCLARNQLTCVRDQPVSGVANASSRSKRSFAHRYSIARIVAFAVTVAGVLKAQPKHSHLVEYGKRMQQIVY